LGHDLWLRFASSDQLRVQGHFMLPSLRIESFRFSDGVVWGESSIQERLRAVASL